MNLNTELICELIQFCSEIPILNIIGNKETYSLKLSNRSTWDNRIHVLLDIISYENKIYLGHEFYLGHDSLDWNKIENSVKLKINELREYNKL